MHWQVACYCTSGVSVKCASEKSSNDWISTGRLLRYAMLRCTIHQLFAVLMKFAKTQTRKQTSSPIAQSTQGHFFFAYSNSSAICLAAWSVMHRTDLDLLLVFCRIVLTCGVLPIEMNLGAVMQPLLKPQKSRRNRYNYWYIYISVITGTRSHGAQ